MGTSYVYTKPLPRLPTRQWLEGTLSRRKTPAILVTGRTSLTKPLHVPGPSHPVCPASHLSTRSANAQLAARQSSVSQPYKLFLLTPWQDDLVHPFGRPSLHYFLK